MNALTLSDLDGQTIITLRGWFLCRDSATREKFTTHSVMLSEVPDRPGLMDPTGDDDGMVDIAADRAFFGGF